MNVPEPIRQLTDAGVAIWLDDLSRAPILDRRLEQVVHACRVTGITSNPTILHRAISSEQSVYEGELRLTAGGGYPPAAALQKLVGTDIRMAADLLRPIYDDSDRKEGWVSVEVDPRLTADADATVAQAHALRAEVGRPNVLVKIPATPGSLPAIERCVAGGISVNVTLIFGQRRYQQVIDAWINGLERAAEAGHDLSRIASVASFFVSRIDTAVDRRLAYLDPHDERELRGATALAVARLAYRTHERSLRTLRWTRLADAAARPQRLLWASTGTKNPAYADTRYVTGLVVPNTINTMNPATLEAFADHGVVPAGDIHDTYGAADKHLQLLEELGIDTDQVAEELEADGVAAFVESWTALLDLVGSYGRARRGLRR